jgi:hypothetical protein
LTGLLSRDIVKQVCFKTNRVLKQPQGGGCPGVSLMKKNGGIGGIIEAKGKDNAI